MVAAAAQDNALCVCSCRGVLLPAVDKQALAPCIGPLHALPAAQQRAPVCRPSWQTGCTTRQSMSPSRSGCPSLSRPPSTPPPTYVLRCAMGARRACHCPATSFVNQHARALGAGSGAWAQALQCGGVLATNERMLRGALLTMLAVRIVGTRVLLGS